MTYTIAEIEVARRIALEAHLSFPKEFLAFPAEKLATVCNGGGAENQPEKARKILTWIYRNYAVAAMIHDLRYALCVGSRAEADAEFHDNMLILWRRLYRILRRLNPVARWAKFKIDAAFAAVREFGESAWTPEYVK